MIILLYAIIIDKIVYIQVLFYKYIQGNFLDVLIAHHIFVLKLCIYLNSDF